MTFHVSAQTEKELLAKLSCIDITVPQSGAGRTSSHRETWCICRLLTTLVDYDVLRCPLDVSRPECRAPDFSILSDGRQIGVEVTEATHKQFAWYCPKKEPGTIIHPEHFGLDAPDRDKQEMDDLVRRDGNPTPSYFEEGTREREWAGFLIRDVDAKLEQLAAPDVKRHAEEWLAIYDNVPIEWLGFNLRMAVEHLWLMLRDRWSKSPAFARIFIEAGKTIVSIGESRLDYMDLQDIWRQE